MAILNRSRKSAPSLQASQTGQSQRDPAELWLRGGKLLWNLSNTIEVEFTAEVYPAAAENRGAVAGLFLRA